jgi:hypothetical protein
MMGGFGHVCVILFQIGTVPYSERCRAEPAGFSERNSTMIVFDVKCSKDHVFEGWFSSSAGFEEQVAAGEVACPICGDLKVAKALMAPNVATTKAAGKGVTTTVEAPSAVPAAVSAPDTVMLAKQKEQAGQVMAMMRAVKEHVEQNFDNVGTKFADEAKKIHYGEAEKRNIYGQATKEQAEELLEDGIEFGALPELPKLDG